MARLRTDRTSRLRIPIADAMESGESQLIYDPFSTCYPPIALEDFPLAHIHGIIRERDSFPHVERLTVRTVKKALLSCHINDDKVEIGLTSRLSHLIVMIRSQLGRLSPANGGRGTVHYLSSSSLILLPRVLSSAGVISHLLC
jgi:hypothetical protein